LVFLSLSLPCHAKYMSTGKTTPESGVLQIYYLPLELLAHSMSLYMNKAELFKVSTMSKFMRSAALIANDLQNQAVKKRYYYQWQKFMQSDKKGQELIMSYNTLHILMKKSATYVKQNDVLALQQQ